jgi:hypothetical protein
MERFNHYFALFEDLKKETRGTADEFNETNCRRRVELLSKIDEAMNEPDFERQHFPFEIKYVADKLAEARAKLEQF